MIKRVAELFLCVSMAGLAACGGPGAESDGWQVADSSANIEAAGAPDVDEPAPDIDKQPPPAIVEQKLAVAAARELPANSVYAAARARRPSIAGSNLTLAELRAASIDIKAVVAVTSCPPLCAVNPRLPIAPPIAGQP